MTIVRNCPFCDYDLVEIGEIEPGRFAVDCPNCECIGPFGDNFEDAITMWNSAHDKNLSLDRAVKEVNDWYRTTK